MASFQDDADFCSQYTETVLLVDGPRRVLLAPRLQARVLTSSLNGSDGASLGWVNRDCVAQQALRPDFNPYGGEDRIWIGPEAGQFGYHFPPGAPFDLKHSRVPSVVDREPFETVSRENRRAIFRKIISMPNHSGVLLEAALNREVSLLDSDVLARLLGGERSGLVSVGFRSVNTLTHTGSDAWLRSTGVPVPWVIGMFPATPTTTIVIPIHPGEEKDLGTAATCYFGALGPDRLRAGSNAVFFKGDGAYRSKIGVGPKRSRGILGSWDSGSGILTVARCPKPEAEARYANFLWERQSDPFSGDGIQSYNDGPPEPGAPAYGPFYELETVAPVVETEPGGTIHHIHETLHFAGERAALSHVAVQLLGVSLEEIEAAF